MMFSDDPTPPSTPNDNTLDPVTMYAQLWAKHTATPVVYRELLLARWPDQFAVSAGRLDNLPTVLFQAALVDIASVCELAVAFQIPLGLETLSTFSSAYFPALLQAARHELHSFLADTKHAWFDEHSWSEACQAYEKLERLLMALQVDQRVLSQSKPAAPDAETPPKSLTQQKSPDGESHPEEQKPAKQPEAGSPADNDEIPCLAPPKGKAVPLAWARFERAIYDASAADGLYTWQVCLFCGAIWPARTTQEEQRNHVQPMALSVFSLTDALTDWLKRLAPLLAQERSKLLRAVDQAGVRATLKALTPAVLERWQAYLEVCGNLAADTWLLRINARQGATGAQLVWVIDRQPGAA
jgi:hypothetical protein